MNKTIPVTYAPFFGTDGRLYTRPERVLEPVNMEMRALRRPPQTTIVRNPETIGMRVMALLEHGYDYGSHRHRMRCPYAVMNHNPRTGEVEEVFVSRGFTPAKERRFAIKRRRERLAAALRALTHLD